MSFSLPPYQAPAFDQASLAVAPVARFVPVDRAGIAPDGYHATSVYPEYAQVSPGEWVPVPGSRMDCCIVRRPDGGIEAREARRLAVGDLVAIGRTEDGSEGILVHTEGFAPAAGTVADRFAFRSRVTRETAFSIDYDELYELLAYERNHGFIAWVAGPAVVFDHDARTAFCSLIRNGFAHALLAGNALATHDIEGAIFGTALGQELYSKRPVAGGHYRHLDAINRVRAAGSIRAAVDRGDVPNGVMRTLVDHDVPYVLAGSIRDDGPMPEVIADVYEAQDRMRQWTRQATTVIALATQLHSIAVGNMTPSYQILDDGTIRPVYFLVVDMSEFAADKLANRGSLTARVVLTNVQDFVVTLERGLTTRSAGG